MSYLEDVGSHLESVEEKYKEYQKKKLYKENYEAKKNEYSIESEKLLNVKLNLMFIGNDKQNKLNFLNLYGKMLKRIQNF